MKLDQSGPMRFAYADPPYLGQGVKHYGTHHDEAHVWDSIETHARLIAQLVDEYPDGWALSLSSTSLQRLLPYCPDGVRIGAWVKPFAVFKRNVRMAYSWEPVIVSGGRRSSQDGAPVGRDYISENIALRKKLPGAKPERVMRFVLDMLGFKPGDTVVDLFPGTGAMGRVTAAVTASPEILRDRFPIRMENP